MEWKFTEEDPLRVVTLFSGYDSQCLALRGIGIPFDLVAWSEIDPYAIKAHDALFPEYAGRNKGDVSKIDWSEVEGRIDLLTYSSPCQDFSNAGLQKGGEEGSGTRSSLLWEVKRAILAKRPGFLLMENVKALVSEKFLPTFRMWLDWLSREGYVNFVEVLNAKDYNVPQNRERVFVVSMLENTWYHFPQKMELRLKMKDLLEQKVDEKYYLDQEKVDQFISGLSDEKLKVLENA
jgi:DNA (cytosine-5)-methyltransferase 1